MGKMNVFHYRDEITQFFQNFSSVFTGVVIDLNCYALSSANEREEINKLV